MDHRKLIKYLIILLFLLNLIPVWGFKFIPTQDGLNHVYNAYILKEYNNPQYMQYRQVYDLNIKPFPNWSSHAFFFLALHIMPPLLAEKVFVTIYMLLMPLSFFYFFSSVDKRLFLWGFLGFLYSYNVLFHLGFYNFAISIPLYFFLMGYWWKHREELGWKQALILNLLLIITYFSHLFSFALSLLSIPLLAFTSAVLPWQEKKTFKCRSRLLINSVLYILPSYIILLLCMLLNPEEKTSSYKSFKELLDFFISVKSLVSYNDRYVIISKILLGFMGVCFLATLCLKFISLFIGYDNKRYRRFFSQRDGFFILFIVQTVLYFKIPWAYGPPAWLNDRANLFLLPILAAFFFINYPRWLKIGISAIIIMLSLAHLGLTVYDYNLLNKDMEEFTSGAGMIEDNASITIMTNDYYYAQNHGTIKYLSPFLHDTCYYCFGNGSHYVGNYEPKYAYFPLKYKEGYWKFEYKGVIDYVLVWHLDDNSPEVVQLKQDYNLIHQTQNMKLFKHK